jgi:rhamnulokinase/L-fuculokinase
MKVLAFDFGASSGRAILGSLENGKIKLEEVHRFDNEPVSLNDGFYWDLPRLFHEIKQGIRKVKDVDFKSIGIDTWGVDYALVSKDGKILSNPYNYRDERTLDIPEKIREIISDKDLYMSSGIQALNFNTIYQLYADKTKTPEIYDIADKFIMIPELFGYLLTGEIYCEKSEASTSALLEPYTKEWNWELIEKIGLKKSLFPKLVSPGTKIGMLKKEVCEELEMDTKPFIAVAGHDTASAVAAVPATEKSFVYISCGTWSLFGTELDSPCITEKSAELNITNETGYNDTTRFLKNIIGLWIIQETRRQFKRDGKEYSFSDMAAMAKEAAPFKCFIDPDNQVFVTPGNQVQRIKDFCKKTGQAVPETDAEVIRCIYESLAMKYKYTFEDLKACTENDFAAIHMVGGGTQAELLCQMTADATGVPVIAGPIEATAIGNIAVQLIALGEIKDLTEARKIIASSFDVIKYEPKDNGFNEAYDRFKKILD